MKSSQNRLLLSLIDLFSWSMLFDPRTSLSAWLVVILFWLYVVVMVISCFVHWWHIYRRVQLNRVKDEERKTSKTRSPMVRSMFSITALERRDSFVSRKSSTVRYKQMKEKNGLKLANRTCSDSAVTEEKKQNLEYKTFHV